MGANNEVQIEIRSVSKRFGGVVALDNVSFQIRRGELLAICGENGAGKSTLMKILCGQHLDYDGDIVVNGETVRFSGIKDAERFGIGIIHQELNLVDELSVAANIFLGRELSRFGLLCQKTMNERAAAFLNQLQCEISPSIRVGALRVGDQQLVEIAKAIGLGAKILIMDEPTSALTESEVTRLYRVITSLRQRGVTILYISHKMEEIFHLSDRIAVLRDGRYIDTVDTANVTPRQIAQMMVGREFVQTDLRRASKHGENGEQPVLAVRGLWRSWPGHAKHWRLKDICFDVHAGEVVGVAGLMGAGRTELFECLYGCCGDEFGGDIRLQGEQVQFKHAQDAIRHGVSMVTEDRKRFGLFTNLTVRENVTLSSLEQFTSLGWISSRKERSVCRSIIERLRVKLAGQEAEIQSLSGGNQQKCLIGRALLNQPKLLLLDDPTRGIDVGAKAEVYQLLNELAQNKIAILMSSSELPELILNCDRIIVLCEGRQTGMFSASEATEQAIMEAATAIDVRDTSISN
ncbi:MAG TPA: sugar ABC transporter ATP-binding protein [Pirellulaceae bacterium]|nr:sugar ABC transporter ATP-binding protein [Pirellulaceae bacterium]HMO91174.1 sugar ABC transporter ATP-binding protein [Pirellulaceae bacterium]